MPTWVHYALGLRPSLEGGLENQETMQWKGGALTMLAKVPLVNEASQYHGVMLLSKPPRWAASHGFPHQQVVFGSAYIRILSRRAYGRKAPAEKSLC